MDEIKPFTDRIKKHQEEIMLLTKERDEARTQVLEWLRCLEVGSANTDTLASDTSYREEMLRLATKWGLPLPD